MEELTSPQAKVLEYIHTSIAEKGSPPTLRELCRVMGYKAIGSAQDVISALRKKGFLEEASKQAARAFSLTQKARENLTTNLPSINLQELLQIPCLGQVPAGNPLEAVEDRVGSITLNITSLAKPRPKAESLYALRCVGTSMVDAGILEDDWLVVNYQKKAESGQIVIARMEDDVTCKRLMLDAKKGWYLKPENSHFKNIFAKDRPFEIIGRVVALQRQIN